MPQELRKRHRGHARPLKHLDERFDWYAEAIEMEPAGCKGRWAQAHLPGASEVRLDLGCGKGIFAVAQAKRSPDVLFVGLDYERPCIARAAQLALEEGAGNAIFTPADAEDVRDLFGEGELSRIYLNFPTPHPRKKHARERLTYVDELVKYRDVLADDGVVEFRTDSPMFYEFSLAQFRLAGYDFLLTTEDLRAEEPGQPETEYEGRLVAKGAKVHAIRAVKADREPCLEQTEPLSLYDYLPEDLDTLDYVPYGMEGGVENLRNYRAKQKAEEGKPLP